MVETLQKLDAVYKKWEERGDKSTLNAIDPEKEKLSKILIEGKQRWKNKFGDSIKPPPIRRMNNRRSNPKLQFKSTEIAIADSIAAFKTTPIVDADSFRITRPFMGQCCTCLPSSRRSLMTGSCTQMGLRNVLDVNHELRNRGPLAKSFCQLAYVLQRRTFYKYTDVGMAVLSCSRVCDAINQKAQHNTQDMAASKAHLSKEESKAFSKREEKCKSTLKTMSAHFSSILVSFTGWFLLKFLPLMTSSVQVHKGQMQLIKKATEKNVPMIYVPLHRSHLDYILVTFILWHYDIKAPHIAAGDNLNMPIFSWLMTRLGAFFIRRSLDKQRGKKDILYRSILQSYVEELLRNGEGIEFFIEGGRTRTGKACSPKAGLLSVVVDAYKSDVIDDAYIVPVTINYEKLLDGNFNNELMGRRKPKETFLAAIKGIFRVIRGDFGHIRIGFCQPFSVKEFMVSQSNVMCPDVSVDEESPSSPSISDDLNQDSSPDGLRSRHGSYSSLLGSDLIDNGQKEAVQNLGQHIVYGAVHSTALMSTNLLAFLLLTKHRQGVSLMTLTDSFLWLKEELTTRKRDVGFTGSTEDVVSHALYLLGEDIAMTSYDKNGNVVIEPNLSVPSVFELSYYSNAVISVFLTESLVVNAMFASLDSGLSLDLTLPGVNTSTPREKLLDVSEELCNIFKNEFIFAPTCEDLRLVLAETVEVLVMSELFQKEEAQMSGAYTVSERHWAKRFTESVEFYNEDSDEEDMHQAPDHIIKVNTDDSDVVDKLRFLQGILGPYLEGYWITALTITKLREREMAEDDFIKLLQSTALKRVEKDLATYSESTSLEILKTALKTYSEQKLINSYFAGNLKMVELRDHYTVEEKLHELLDLLESLRP